MVNSSIHSLDKSILIYKVALISLNDITIDNEYVLGNSWGYFL